MSIPRPRESTENQPEPVDLPRICAPCAVGLHALCAPIPFCECLDRSCTDRLESP